MDELRGHAQVFPLAPMSMSIRFLTWLLLPLPGLFLLAALVRHDARPALVGAAVAALYAAVWLFLRPSRFEVSRAGVELVFPGRQRTIPLAEVARARTFTREALRRELGFALRVGAGGLWGGFGWLWTSRRGLLEMYISRTDHFLWIERRAGKPLLLTPRHPALMAEAIEAALR